MAYNGKPATYGFTSLTGGGSGALDSENGANLIEGDRALVITSTPSFYIYRLNASTSAPESSPDVITPDTNAGTKRWMLCSKGGVIETHDHSDASNGGTISYTDLTDKPTLSSTLTTVSTALSANATLTNGAQWYDGPSISLTVGTWLVTAHITITKSASGGYVVGRISTGTTHYASTESSAGSGSQILSLAMSVVVTVAGTTTIKIQALSDQMGAVMLKETDSSSGDNATMISAVKLNMAF